MTNPTTILRSAVAALAALLLLGTGTSCEAPDPIAAAAAHPERSDTDRARDADRKPAEVLAFIGIEPGMRVADLAAGGGYYTEIVARAVGSEGRVLLQNNRWSYERFGDMGVPARLARPGLEHVERWDHDLGALALPEGELDAVLLILFYHDLYWLDQDREAMLAGVMRGLVPGGVFAVIDHHAVAGSGERDVETLHRGDAALIKREILDAGFEWVGEAAMLRNPADDRTRNVFEKGMRGKTDRFVYLFRKPR